jgi:hypothetical protein
MKNAEIVKIQNYIPESGNSINLNKCVACGQPASVGTFCNYCHEMREDLRCWPKR